MFCSTANKDHCGEYIASDSYVCKAITTTTGGSSVTECKEILKCSAFTADIDHCGEYIASDGYKCEAKTTGTGECKVTKCEEVKIECTANGVDTAFCDKYKVRDGYECKAITTGEGTNAVTNCKEVEKTENNPTNEQNDNLGIKLKLSSSLLIFYFLI